MRTHLVDGGRDLRIRRSGGDDIVVRADLASRERDTVLAGGLLNAVRARPAEGVGPMAADAAWESATMPTT